MAMEESTKGRQGMNITRKENNMDNPSLNDENMCINPEWENAQFEVVFSTFEGLALKRDRFRTVEDAENLTNPIPQFIIQTEDKE